MREKRSTKMVLDRRATLRHLSGQSVTFEPGVPVGVAPQLVKSAIGMGAKVVDGVTPNLLDEEPTPVNRGPIDPDERMQEITEVVAQMIERNDRDEWTGTGTPNVQRVTELLGYKVQKNEVVDAFAKARHKGAEVVEADD
jgi:hypothetical protein